VQRAQQRALSEARLSLSVPSPISFSSRADMRSKSACDPEYLWCAAVLYCPATNAESASDESSSSVPEAYSEPPCCRRSRQPSGGRRRRSAVLQHMLGGPAAAVQHWRCRTCQGPAGLLAVRRGQLLTSVPCSLSRRPRRSAPFSPPNASSTLQRQRLHHCSKPRDALASSGCLSIRQADWRPQGSWGHCSKVAAANSPPQQVLRVHLSERADLGVRHLHHLDGVLQVPVQPRVGSGGPREGGC
jgi:hypothetical protein